MTGLLPEDLGAIAGTLVLYGALCLLFGWTLGYVFGVTARERWTADEERRSSGRNGRGGAVAGRY